MSLLESGQMYLETILQLSRTLPHVRAIDIGSEMGFSKPSVSRAVNKLKADGYINIDNNGYITLTTLGRNVAESMLERHILLTQFFTSIGVDEKTAAEDACKIEHDISEETFIAIRNYINRE